jgi:hypothetical protein
VLIETITAAFEMEEIIYELRAHSAGLNCGRWDYIFSFIKKFRNHASMVLPNRWVWWWGGAWAVGGVVAVSRRGMQVSSPWRGPTSSGSAPTDPCKHGTDHQTHTSELKAACVHMHCVASRLKTPADTYDASFEPSTCCCCCCCSCRADVTMTSPFMDAYVQLLIKTCHRRGVHAMGGMAAQIPIKNDPAANEAAINKVCGCAGVQLLLLLFVLLLSDVG